jgi:hypothetical protein
MRRTPEIPDAVLRRAAVHAGVARRDHHGHAAQADLLEVGVGGGHELLGVHPECVAVIRRCGGATCKESTQGMCELQSHGHVTEIRVGEIRVGRAVRMVLRPRWIREGLGCTHPHWSSSLHAYLHSCQAGVVRAMKVFVSWPLAYEMELTSGTTVVLKNSVVKDSIHLLPSSSQNLCGDAQTCTYMRPRAAATTNLPLLHAGADGTLTSGRFGRLHRELS